MGTNIKTDDLVYPYFVVSGKDRKEEIVSFPGQYRFSVDRLLEDIAEADKLGIDKVLLFGIPDSKDKMGNSAYLGDDIISAAVTRIKKAFPHITVITDVCLCAYTDHGHCRILDGKKIDTEKTLEALSKMALKHAKAGADYVAPSAMAKGQVRAIRKALDENGYKKTKILGYSAKFASNFYGPFRSAANSAPKFGDRRAYQLDYKDAKVALKKIEDDIKERADIVMIKPALSYLDIIKETKMKFPKPIAAYNVSGEYAFVKYGAKAGLWDEKAMVFEIITSIKRAGADIIITYHAKDLARWLKE